LPTSRLVFSLRHSDRTTTVFPPAPAPNLFGTFNKHDRVFFGQSILVQCVEALFSRHHWVHTGHPTNAAAPSMMSTQSDSSVNASFYNARRKSSKDGQSNLYRIILSLFDRCFQCRKVIFIIRVKSVTMGGSCLPAQSVSENLWIHRTSISHTRFALLHIGLSTPTSSCSSSER
jgi:hypothetical protein